MYVPVGFAHGFLTLEDDVTVQYKVSDYYAPKSEIGIRWNDPEIAVPWPIVKRNHPSEKDRQHPLLQGIFQPVRI